MSARSRPRPARLPWVDAAKALAIVLVVVYHVSGSGMTQLGADADDVGLRFWRLVSSALVPVRMPLFFLASGLLAARALNRPWPRLIRPRFTNLLWPFVLWSTVFAVVGAVALAPAKPWDYLVRQLWAIPVGGTAYWYLSVLMVLFLVARTFRAWPVTLLLVGVIALAVAPHLTGALSEPIGAAAATNVARLCYFAIWFFLGCFGQRMIELVTDNRSRSFLPVWIAGYALLAYLVYVAGVAISAALLTVVGLVASIAATQRLVALPGMATLARYLAGRTLPIYVLHPVMLNLLIIGNRWLEGSTLSVPWVSTLVLPISVVPLVSVPLVSIALTWLATISYDAVQGTRLARLFSPPLIPASGTSAAVGPAGHRLPASPGVQRR